VGRAGAGRLLEKVIKDRRKIAEYDVAGCVERGLQLRSAMIRESARSLQAAFLVRSLALRFH
jgi:hypothetical protein